jgi:hypothetical protein
MEGMSPCSNGDQTASVHPNIVEYECCGPLVVLKRAALCVQQFQEAKHWFAEIRVVNVALIAGIID